MVKNSHKRHLRVFTKSIVMKDPKRIITEGGEVKKIKSWIVHVFKSIYLYI